MKKVIFLLIILGGALFSRENLSEESPYIDVYFEKYEDGGYDFYADNNHFIPMTIYLDFPSLKNLNIDREKPVVMVLAPGERGTLLASLRIKAKGSYSFRSRLNYSYGDINNANPDNYIYTFPFAHGEKRKVDQGYGGKFSHSGENFFALDFPMDEGTPIHAARGGVVIDVKEDSNRGGVSSSYDNDGNYVIVYHSDGTFGSYVHLKKDGSLVEVGDIIEAGDKIGLSGNTGFSSGPHLHFAVSIPHQESGRQSVPVEFYNYDGKSVTPKVGEYYYSSHPGMESFEVFFATSLTNEDFKDYLADVNSDNKVNIRFETIDSTTIIFLKNGLKSEIDGTLKLSGSNLSSTVEFPFSVKVPPLKEVFIGIIRPKDPSKSHRVQTSLSYTYSK